MRFSLSNPLKKKDQTKSIGSSKLKEHWGTIASLIGIFIIALFVRSYFAFDIATNYGSPFLISGGSDAYYHRRIIEYITTNHHHLLNEQMLNFPLGRTNPRPPLFGWTVSVMAYILSPIVGDVQVSAEYVFMLSVGIWGALTIFPTYLIGRDTFGKKAGITAAFLLAISAAHLQRGVITNGDHDTFAMFFGVTGFYFFMRALKGIDPKKNWIQDWLEKKEIKKGFSEFISENKKQLLYAAMTGACFGAVALTWQGYAYMIAIVLVFYGIQLFSDKFKKRDSLGVTMCVFVSLSITFILAAPYYVTTGVGAGLPHRVGQFFDVPLLLFLGMMVVGVYFTVTRDLPWLFVLGVFASAAASFLVLGFYFFRSFIETLIGGGGYFIQTPVYATIAEAQPPDFSNLVLATGILTFFLCIAGIGFAIWHLKKNWNPAFIFVLIWTAFALYMAVSAGRFMFNAAPAFAVPAGWVVALAVDKADFPQVAWRIKTYRGNIFKGIYEAFKIKHISIILIVLFLIFLPNAIHAFDAGIPFERKREFDDQIYHSLPEFMRPPEYDVEERDTWYLGAFGYSLDDPGDYWPAAWSWLRNQNTDTRPEDRPGFLSWWDYGFEAAGEGRHPSVADNFQTAYRFAGNVLLAQNESETIGLLVVRMLEKEIRERGEFGEEIRSILVEHIGEEKTTDLERVMKNPRDDYYKEEVLSNPDRYHPRAEDIHFQNVKYAYTMGLLSYECVHDLADLYREICLELDDQIKYIAVDTRLFPLSGRQTGVFYAPAKLSGHRIDDSHGMRTPIDFYDINFIDTERNVYTDPDDIPEGAQIVDQRIEHKPMFFNTTLYRTFAGYGLHETQPEEMDPGDMEMDPGDIDMGMPNGDENHGSPSSVEMETDNPEDDKISNSLSTVSLSSDNPEGDMDPGDIEIDPGDMEDPGMDPGMGMPGEEPTEEGIPGIDDRDAPPMPGWNMTYFNMAYRTAYFNPYEDFQNHTDAWRAISYEKAIEKQEEGIGTVDMSGRAYMTQGVVFLEYNDGAIVEGYVETEDGEPLQDVTVTVLDKKMVPSHVTSTDEDGYYRVIAPPGDNTMIVSKGNMDRPVLQTREVQLDMYEFKVTEEMAKRKEIDRTRDGTWDFLIEKDFEVESAEIDGRIFIDKDGSSEYNPQNDTAVDGDVELTHTKSGRSFVDETVDGYFEFTGLPPGTYSLEADVEGTQVKDNIRVDPGESKTIDMKIPTGGINLNISYEKTRDLPKEIVLQAQHERTGITYDQTIEEEGGYLVDHLITGNYNARILTDGCTIREGNYRFRIEQDERKNITLEILPGEILEGTAVLEGRPLENQRITIISTSDTEFRTTVKTGSRGQFSIRLPDDEYRLYGKNLKDGRAFVYSDLISFTSELEIEAEFIEGYRVQGDVSYDDSPMGRYNLLFTHESGKEVSVITNNYGRFSTHLIPGEYDVYGWKDEDFRTLVSMDEYTIYRDTSLDINAITGTVMSGTVSRELKDEVPEQEFIGIRSDIEILIQGKSISRGRTSPDGDYELIVPERRCTIRFSADGFVTQEIEYIPQTKVEKDVSLPATDVNLGGDILYETYMPESLSIKFEAICQGAVDKETTITGTDYSVKLQPGIYNIIVNETFDNDNRRLHYSEEVELEPGKNLEIDIHIQEQLLLEGVLKYMDNEVLKGDVSFRGPETKNISTDGDFNVYLLPGSYGIKAHNVDKDLASHTSFDLEQPSSIEITMSEIYIYSTLVDYDGVEKTDVTVEIENLESGFIYTNTTDEEGQVSFSLAKGEYELSIDHIEREPVEGVLSNVRYFHSETGYAEELSTRIHLDRELYNATLSGRVLVKEVGVENVEIDFIANSPEAISTSTTTQTNGEYEIELFQGLYTIYVSYDGSRLHSTLEIFAMGEEDNELDIELKRASRIEGNVKRAGTVIDSEVKIQRPEVNAEKTISTDQEGYYEIILPNDKYTITSERKIGDNIYQESRDIELASSRVLDLNLKLVKEYGIEVSDIHTISASQGDRISLDIDITNTGNVRDEFELSSETAVWDIEFSPKIFKIGSGRTRTVELTINVADDAAVDHPPIRFEVSSLNSDEIEEMEIPFDINPIYDVEILPEVETKTFRGGSLDYTLNIRNNGNVEDRFSVKILNRNELLNRGWNATISDEYITIGEQQNGEITLTLKPTRRNPSSNVEVLVSCTSVNDRSTYDSASVSAEIPKLESDPDRTELVGEDISFEKIEFSLETWHWAVIILLIGSISIYIMKKERWI